MKKNECNGYWHSWPACSGCSCLNATCSGSDVNRTGCHEEAEVKKAVELTCCCCGGVAVGRQHQNRDTGFGLCSRCAKWIKEITFGDDMYKTYGIDGYHYFSDENQAREALK